MAHCGSLLMTALVAIALVLVAASGSTVEKVAPCCKQVDKIEINEPVKKYWIQKANAPCVEAIIFETENDLLCKYPQAPWVMKKILEIRKARAQAKMASPTSLLSAIVSATTSSSTSSSSSSSTVSSAPSTISPSSSTPLPSSSSSPSSSSTSSSSSTTFSSSSPSPSSTS
ncbi:unnamed protein product [Ophioblennius macclurei]